ncbi:DUF4270 family protein [Pedobacter sp. ASV28]|uniref:DUF4270 family protein n=1 Tax=Pedobacter sp. ASV28 TaxID=2795123 RepID=UPI0018EC582C|nr:DUF4270 family protein [Pedobacter sp. ASV28]
MKFSKLDLLTLLISLFLFASCENTATIGLEVDPTSAVQGDLIDSATIVSRTVKDDAVATNLLTRYPFGYLKDPVLGETESALAMAVNLPVDAYDFGTSPVLDSAVLVLNYSGEFYGDSTAVYSVDVHQLSNDLTQETSYLSSKTYPYGSTLLANYTGKVFPNTKYKVTDIVVGAADTLKTVTPQLRLKLDPTFVTNQVVGLNAATLKYNSYFQSSFKGLHVQIKKASSTGIGGIMFFDFASTNSGLFLYYKKQNATTTTAIDTVSVNFPIATSTAAVAASVKHIYSTAVQQQLDNPSLSYPVTYLQPMGGLRNKFSFPYLKKLRAEVGKMIVNKAELVIDLSSGTDVAPFRAAQRLALYRNDIAGQRKNLPDNDGGSYYVAGDPRANVSAFGGYFDSTKKRYVFLVTAYIQDLIDGKTEDYGTFLAPSPLSTFEYTSSFNTAGRAIIGSFKKSPSAGDNIIKLNIYYTKIN